MAEACKTVTLKNGISIRFVDQSNRYFGDFHRVFIRVTISLPAGLSKERAGLEKTLEKMGVPTAAVKSTREALIDSFLRSSAAYMEKDDFPRLLLARLQNEKPKPIFLRNR